MIVDSSALLAVVLDEPDGHALPRPCRAPALRMSAATWFEAAIVVDTHRNSPLSRFDDVRDCGSNHPVHRGTRHDPRRYAIWARHHPARLNFGDCMVYGVAKSRARAVLFKGDDFSQTDIEPALKD